MVFGDFDADDERLGVSGEMMALSGDEGDGTRTWFVASMMPLRIKGRFCEKLISRTEREYEYKFVFKQQATLLKRSSRLILCDNVVCTEQRIRRQKRSKFKRARRQLLNSISLLV